MPVAQIEVMNGETKWEEAWRAFDADVQAVRDSAFLTGNVPDPEDIFNDISEEFDIGSARACSEPGEACEYEKAWRQLGAWIYRSDPDIELACEKYAELNEKLELGDDVWNEMA